MKRIFFDSFAIVLACLLTLSVALLSGGCGSKSTQEQPEGQSASPIEEKGLVPGAKEEAGSAAREANLRMIDGAIQTYMAETGTAPTSINQLVPVYMKSVPVDPLGGTYYIQVVGGQTQAAIN